MNLEYINNKNLGLVLSGGGFRGMAHIGILEVLNSYGIKPAYISGTSVGAITCQQNNIPDDLCHQQ